MAVVDLGGDARVVRLHRVQVDALQHVRDGHGRPDPAGHQHRRRSRSPRRRRGSRPASGGRGGGRPPGACAAARRCGRARRHRRFAAAGPGPFTVSPPRSGRRPGPRRGGGPGSAHAASPAAAATWAASGIHTPTVYTVPSAPTSATAAAGPGPVEQPAGHRLGLLVQDRAHPGGVGRRRQRQAHLRQRHRVDDRHVGHARVRELLVGDQHAAVVGRAQPSVGEADVLDRALGVAHRRRGRRAEPVG